MCRLYLYPVTYDGIVDKTLPFKRIEFVFSIKIDDVDDIITVESLNPSTGFFLTSKFSLLEYPTFSIHHAYEGINE